MNIKVRNSQLNNETVQALNSLIDMDINASAAFKLTRIIKDLSSILDDKVKMEKKILDKWIEKDALGNPVRPKDEAGNDIESAVNITNVDAFSQEMADLMNTEVELQHEKINFDDLKLSTAKVKDLMKLDFLFD